MEAEAQLEQAHPQESRWTGVAEEVVGRLEKTDSPHSLWEELAAQAVHAEPARPPQEQHSRFAPSQTEPCH